jgi:hypothetical protein
MRLDELDEISHQTSSFDESLMRPKNALPSYARAVFNLLLINSSKNCQVDSDPLLLAYERKKS